MLHQDVLMADIDVDQWRNAQSLLLRSAKGTRRLIVIHENGEVVKFRHTAGVEVTGRVDRVDDPHTLARKLFEANADLVDFVVVMERNAVDSYFAQIQDAWDIDADLDVFVQQTYAALDDYGDGIVTYPGTARDTLGLQWRIGSSLDDVNAAARALVTPGSTVVLGVHENGVLWASLLLDFDEDWKVTSITTADPSLVDTSGPPAKVLDSIIEWLQGAGKSVSLGLVLDGEGARDLLAAPTADKAAVLARIHAQGRVAARP